VAILARCHEGLGQHKRAVQFFGLAGDEEGVLRNQRRQDDNDRQPSAPKEPTQRTPPKRPQELTNRKSRNEGPNRCSQKTRVSNFNRVKARAKDQTTSKEMAGYERKGYDPRLPFRLYSPCMLSQSVHCIDPLPQAHVISEWSAGGYVIEGC